MIPIVQIQVEATVGESGYGDIAVDSFRLERGACPGSIYICNMYTSTVLDFILLPFERFLLFIDNQIQSQSNYVFRKRFKTVMFYDKTKVRLG